MDIDFKNPFKILIIVILITSLIILIIHNLRTDPDWIERIKKIDDKIKNGEVKYDPIIENNELKGRRYYNVTHFATDNINRKGKTFRRDYYDENGEVFARSFYDGAGKRVAYMLHFDNESVTIPVILQSEHKKSMESIEYFDNETMTILVIPPPGIYI